MTLFKKVMIVLHLVKIRFANRVLHISLEIKLIEWAIQRILRILSYFSVIILRAFWMFAPASDTTAENFSGPICSIISSISFAKKAPVWLSSDKFFKHHKYSLWVDVWMRKFQIDSFVTLVHPSHALNFK